MKTKSFDSLAGWSAIFAAVFALLYAISFVVLKSDLLSALFLLLGGLAAAIVMTALYQRLRDTQAAYALLAFVLSAGAAAGAMIHGGYDLSNALHPPATINLDLPNPVDPRGLLTFGLAGVSLFVICWLMSHNKTFPKNLAYLGYLSALLMIVLYLGRLVILNATSPAILLPAALEGFIVNPLWYLWLGIVLRRAK
jgi:hypothetical protein